MADRNEDLYETRTNLLSCDNMVDYFWRKCDRNSYPFKPNSALDIHTKEIDSDMQYGKDIYHDYIISEKDIKNCGIKPGSEYNFDRVAYETYDFNKQIVSKGEVILVYKPDRKWYSLFLLENANSEKPTLTLLMRVKQKVSLFGSFENQLITFY